MGTPVLADWISWKRLFYTFAYAVERGLFGRSDASALWLGSLLRLRWDYKSHSLELFISSARGTQRSTHYGGAFAYIDWLVDRDLLLKAKSYSRKWTPEISLQCIASLVMSKLHGRYDVVRIVFITLPGVGVLLGWFSCLFISHIMDVWWILAAFAVLYTEWRNGIPMKCLSRLVLVDLSLSHLKISLYRPQIGY